MSTHKSTLLLILSSHATEKTATSYTGIDIFLLCSFAKINVQNPVLGQDTRALLGYDYTLYVFFQTVCGIFYQAYKCQHLETANMLSYIYTFNGTSTTDLHRPVDVSH